LVYADYVNILDESVHIIEKNTGALVVASKEARLEVTADKSKYMVMYPEQNSGRSQNIQTEIIPLKSWKSSNTWEQTEKKNLKFYSGRNQAQIDVKECLLSFGG